MLLRRFFALAIAAALGGVVGPLASEAAPGPTPSGTPVATASPLRSPAPAADPSVAPAGGTATIPSPAPSPGTLALPFPSAAVLGALAGTSQSYTTFMKGADREPGVITLLRKDDDLYFDLGPGDFGKTFIISPSLATGVGSGAFAGRVYDPFFVTFKRVGKRVLWIVPNTRYVARAGSAHANSLAVSVADSVLLSSPIVAESADKTHVVIAPSILLTDFEGIGADLGKSATPPSLPGLLIIGLRTSFGIDAGKSYYGRVKAFPQNDEIDANLTFTGPENALPTVPDGRGIPLVVHYSIVVPPPHDADFVPRYADDRVGYFITADKRYDNDALASPFERFIERWNIDHGPITFYLTNEIPKEYRATVRRGILAWNDAFARIGHPHAIRVLDPPSDPAWDPDDARYSVVRWITSDTSDFAAYSSPVADPVTGQIMRSEVVIDGEALRAIKRGYVDTVLPARRLNGLTATDPNDLDVAPSCAYESGSVAQAALGMMTLAAHPSSSAQREAYAQAWLYAAVMHEVGHALGLRHNFAGETAYTLAQLHDPAFTRAYGTSASVMGYMPANVAAPGERQASYFTDRLGVYDYWAIAYGYTRFATQTSDGELPYLRRIADESTRPGLAYGTDEDAIEPLGIDPKIQPFELSNDPLAFERDAFALDDSLASRLDRTYPGDHRSYADLRASLVTIFNNELQNATLATHYLGGIYTSRSHRGQPGAVAPLRPVSRAEEKRAFALLDRYIFSSRAFNYSPALLNELEPPRYGFHWDSGGLRRLDFPIGEVIAEIQDDTISSIFTGPTLARIYDESLKSRPGETMSLADLLAWMNGAVFDDLGRPQIAPAHRELQRRFADFEMEITDFPSGALDQLGLPRALQALTRSSLQHVAARLPAAQVAARDPGTRAHLADLRARIAGVLHPVVARPI